MVSVCKTDGASCPFDTRDSKKEQEKHDQQQDQKWEIQRKWDLVK